MPPHLPHAAAMPPSLPAKQVVRKLWHVELPDGVDGLPEEEYAQLERGADVTIQKKFFQVTLTQQGMVSSVRILGKKAGQDGRSIAGGGVDGVCSGP